MNSGRYRTPCGSYVEVSGKHSGTYRIAFDWVEENACIECNPYVHDRELHWECEVCGGGWAPLRLEEVHHDSTV